jgi:hypothetical protein
MASNKTTLVGRAAVGIFNDAVINPDHETAQALCPECGTVHSFSDQGLRWVGLGCKTVIFPTLDMVADQATRLKESK